VLKGEPKDNSFAALMNVFVLSFVEKDELLSIFVNPKEKTITDKAEKNNIKFFMNFIIN